MDASRSASSRGPRYQDLRLRPEQRTLLARPLGPVLKGEAARREAAHQGPSISSVGDIVTSSLLEWGVLPFAAVVDGKTLRDRPVPLSTFDAVASRRSLRARSPPGEVTADLQEKVHQLVVEGGGLLVVEGEEDLAVLPLARELPLGATLLYGQPGEGLCFLTLDAGVKGSVKRILDGMEARPT